MSGGTFDLEPPEEGTPPKGLRDPLSGRSPGETPFVRTSQFAEPGLAPAPGRTRPSSTPAEEPEDERTTGPYFHAIFVAPFTSMRMFYLYAALMCGGLLFLLMNPTFQPVDIWATQVGGWPWTHFQGADGGFAFSGTRPQLVALSLTLACLVFLAAALVKASRARGVVTGIVLLLAAAQFAPPPETIAIYLVLVCAAVAAGGIFHHGVVGRRQGFGRRVLLLAAVGALGSMLWMPIPVPEQLEPGSYHSRGLTAVRAHLDPSAAVEDRWQLLKRGEAGASAPLAEHFPDWLGEQITVFTLQLPVVAAMLLFLLGLLVLLGLRGRWLGWLTGFFALVLAIGPGLVMFWWSSGQIPETKAITQVQFGLDQVGQQWHLLPYPFLLAAVAAISDLRRRA